MNKRQENTKTSYEAIEEVLDENAGVTAAVPALSGAVALFKGDFAGMEDAERAVNGAMAGKTSTKHDAEDVLITAEYPIVCALRSLARKNGDKELLAIVNVSESFLAKMRDTELVTLSRSILLKANANAAALAAYNVTAAMLTDLQAKIDAYEKSIGAQGGGMADRSSGHTALKNIFGKLNDDLAEIDDLIELVKKDHPEFYDAYFAARPVKALGTRHKSKTPSTGKAPAPAEQTSTPKKG
jgi:hypothetical protein